MSTLLITKWPPHYLQASGNPLLENQLRSGYGATFVVLLWFFMFNKNVLCMQELMQASIVKCRLRIRTRRDKIILIQIIWPMRLDWNHYFFFLIKFEIVNIECRNCNLRTRLCTQITLAILSFATVWFSFIMFQLSSFILVGIAVSRRSCWPAEQRAFTRPHTSFTDFQIQDWILLKEKENGRVRNKFRCDIIFSVLSKSCVLAFRKSPLVLV